MGFSWLGLLSGAGRAAGQLGSDIQQRELMAEAAKRQQAQDALNLLRTVAPMGGQVLQEGDDPVMSLAKRTEANRLASGGAIPNTALGIPDEATPDAYGTPYTQQIGQSSVLFDPSRSQDAMQERRFAMQQSRLDQRARQAQDAALELERLRQSGRSESEPMEVVMEGGRRVYRPRSAAAGMEAPSPQGPQPDRSIVPVQMPDGSTKYVTREQALGMSPPATTRDSRPSVGERQAAAMLPEIEDAYQRLQNLDPSFFSENFGKLPVLGNYAKTDAGRQYEQTARQFINNTVYLKSGKAITDQEFKRLYGELIDQPGDDQGTRAQKARARELFVQGAYVMGGRAIPKGKTPLGQKPSLSERVQQLKAQGLSKEQARRQLQQEGYNLAGTP